MPTIVNPYKADTSFGDMFTGIADTLFGPKATQAELLRQKANTARRENEFMPLVAEGLRTPGFDPGLLTSHAVQAGITPEILFGHRSGANIAAMDPTTLNTPAGKAAITQNLLSQPKFSYSGTPQAHDADIAARSATALAQQDKVILADELKNQREVLQVHDATNPLGYSSITRAEFLKNPGKYVQVAPTDIFKSAQAGKLFPGWADPNKLAYLDANTKPEAVWNWVAIDPNTGKQIQGTTVDKMTDITTKQSLPPGHVLQSTGAAGGLQTMTGALGTSTKTALDENVMAGEEALGLAGRIRTMVENNPGIIGPAGNALRFGQNVTDVVASLQGLMGGTEKAGVDLEKARMTVRQTLGPTADRLFPEIFSTDLNKVETLHGLLTYKVARALNKGGSLSNMDVEKARALVGTPDSWIKGPTEFLNRLRATEGELAIELDNNKKRRQQNQATAPGATTTPSAVPPGAPTPAPGATAPATTYALPPDVAPPNFVIVP